MNYLFLALMDTTTETVNNSSRLFLYGLVACFSAIFAFNAIKGYKGYSKSVLPHIYDNYLWDYFYMVTIRKDVSRSGRFNKLIGTHRLVYSNIYNQNGQISSTVLAVIHSKGITAVSYLNPNGEVHGNDSKWYVKREVKGDIKNYQLECPVPNLVEYEKRVKQMTELKDIDCFLAVADHNNIDHVHCKYDVVHYSDIANRVNHSDNNVTLTGEQIDELYAKLGGKK